MGLAEIISALQSTLPWFGFFEMAFWGSKVASETLFPSSYKKLSKADQSYWAASMVSTLHAIIVTFYAAITAYEGNFFSSKDLFLRTEQSTLCLRIFVGYILSDSLWCIYYRNEWPGISAMMVHHVIIGMAYVDFLAHDYSHNLALGCLLWEITTPFVNMRWFLSKSGLQHSQPTLYVLNGCIFTLLWFLVRIGLGFYIGIWIYQMKDQIFPNPETPKELQLHPFQYCFSILGTYFIAYSLQWMWFIKIGKGCIKILWKSNKST